MIVIDNIYNYRTAEFPRCVYTPRVSGSERGIADSLSDMQENAAGGGGGGRRGGGTWKTRGEGM